MCRPLRGGRGTYTQKPLKIYREKNIVVIVSEGLYIQNNRRGIYFGILDKSSDPSFDSQFGLWTSRTCTVGVWAEDSLIVTYIQRGM
jgi:hypothetical protein